MSSGSPFREPSLYWAIAVISLLAGASLVYVSIKAPFFWGGIYVPGVLLLNVWAITTVLGTIFALQKRKAVN